MNSFDQLVELTHEAQNNCIRFLEKNQNVSIQEAFMNYLTSKQAFKDIKDKLDKVEIEKDGYEFGYDNCMYYMGLDALHQYQNSALLVLTNKLIETMIRSGAKTTKKEQKESLKNLIKEAVNEMKEEQLEKKTVKIKEKG